MKKRLLSLALCGALLCGALAGCGGNETPSTSQEPSSSQTAEEPKILTTAVSAELNLSLIHILDKANSIDDTPVMDIDGAELRPEDASVRFEDVSFSYGERTILDHVSLTVPAGSTTAVVGPSGGGKTTLCNLIARFWDCLLYTSSQHGVPRGR